MPGHDPSPEGTTQPRGGVPTAAVPELVPVLLGGDIGVYALARCFHEAYRVRPVCIAPRPTQVLTRSRIVRTVALGEHSEPGDYVEAALDVARRTPGARRVLLANTDWHIRVINDHRQVLAEHFEIPVASAAVAARVSDKAVFAQVCEELGVPTPSTVVQDFTGADAQDWEPTDTAALGYPQIAKPASSAEYNDLRMEGKKKVFVVADAQEAGALWRRLRSAGFRSRFLAQELVGGDDTSMRSLTAYVDSRGRAVLTGSARVLLEDHAPTMLGNPVSMITEPFTEMTEQAIRLLEHVGYRGFANFDIKVDPRDGRALFLEVNPRIGRNCYYMAAAGHNPVTFAVRDLVLGREVEPARVDQEVLYSLLPHRLLRRYLREEALRSRVDALVSSGRTTNPLRYHRDRSLRRGLVVSAQELNQYRKFARYYPQATDTSF
ncbi:ATP-grasp domain-containing protein [Actinomyces wuliandei]|uniref:carboxylate--amine ligase n=1 Tax=Actinomyces wuliandei TaxID=2057743 RepID=UPI001FAA7225|nr:ATP-grasp domain-containing protein [Actinomyces wuliandei]